MTFASRLPLRPLLVILALAFAGAGHAQTSPEARRVIDRARTAMGGQAWNTLRGLHETGREGGARYERWFDPIRYGARFEAHTAAGTQVQGFNGLGEWRILPNGQTTGAADPAGVAPVRTEAFFGTWAWLFPSRFDMRSVHVGVRRADGRSFEVLRVQPAGGLPRELWFDRATGLLGRMVEASGPRPLSVELSDYRRVGSILVPFRARTFGGGAPQTQERQAEAFDVKPVDRALFSLPRP